VVNFKVLQTAFDKHKVDKVSVDLGCERQAVDEMIQDSFYKAKEDIDRWTFI